MSEAEQSSAANADRGGNDVQQPEQTATTNSPQTSEMTPTQQLENQILTELSATVNTLTSISEVLDDILASSERVSRKQEALMKELRRWKDLK